MQRRDVKIEEPVLGIKDFNISIDGGLVGPKRHPVKSPKFFLQRPAERLFWLNPEKLRRRGVNKLDLTLNISHNDTLLQRVENSLEKPFLTREPDKIVLHFFRLNPPDALDQLIDKT